MVSAISHTRLTLALDIIGKLTEGEFAGYHELGIVKQKISLGDKITIEESDTMELTCAFPGVPEDKTNICWQAVELVQKECGVSQNVKIHIDKVIPVQGGLAGGSTNAATVLMLLDELWDLDLSFEEKVALGKKLGMDVPFYFTDGCAFDSEATGVLDPISHSVKMAFALIVPPFGVSTADAYRGINYDSVGAFVSNTTCLKEALESGSYADMVANCHNDFELSVFRVKPKLRDIREELLSLGADAAFMSGSGSTMIGVFESLDAIPDSLKSREDVIICEAV